MLNRLELICRQNKIKNVFFSRELAPNKTLMGNLDPCGLYGDEVS